jgi:formate--tetrahydrofolate ligase
MPTSLEIAQRARLRPIADVASAAGLRDDEIEPYGRHKAKVNLSVLDRLRDRPDGKLVVVTAVTPTAAGEGKTTTAIGLTQGLGRTGTNAMLCMREPSVGPVFGAKGGGTGGGHAQVLPMEDINLHFTGDFHAVAAAHNLLAAALDASIYHDNPLNIEARPITWPRTLDVNDRSLRQIIIGLGGTAHGVPRESGFVITAASEVMAVLALARDPADLRERLGRIVVAETRAGEPVTAEALGVAGAMAVLMKEAARPNLVQTIEGQPVLIHAGPFGNIATGNNSIIADRVATKLADVVVTEAGFGADLGFEKFCHLVCRGGDVRPAAAVVVATVRALKMHGGLPEREAQSGENLDALRGGADNLAAHMGIVTSFGLPCVVAVNRHASDTDRELQLLRELAVERGAHEVALNDGFARGGEGSEELAKAVLGVLERRGELVPVNEPGLHIREQIERIATRLYGARAVELSEQGAKSLAKLERRGLAELPVCMAKTHMSLSHDPVQKGRPMDFVLPVRDLFASVGAGFVVALCGDIMLMPGLGRSPAFARMDVDADGTTVGLA